MGIEQLGVFPDVIVDNEPRQTFDGVDAQLETAVAVLKQWIKDEPIVVPLPPGPKPNMGIPADVCKASETTHSQTP
jgi:C-terminal processing protease CtpA/Prc